MDPPAGRDPGSVRASGAGASPAGTSGAGASPAGTSGAGTIRVRVRLFARLRELADARAVDLEIPAGSTVEDAWAALATARPAIAALRPYVRFAADGAYAEADTPLADGTELACIPPVSGGSGDDAPSPRLRRVLEVTEVPFGASILEKLAARVATDDDGAIVGFLGRTRAMPGTPAPGEEMEAARGAGRLVEALEYEAFEPLALRVLGEIADEVSERFGVDGLAIVHRTGRVPLGEPSVAIVAAAPHRDAAFAAASYAIDETKARAPIWKAELFADGHVWVGAPARTGPTIDGAEAGPDGDGDREVRG